MTPSALIDRVKKLRRLAESPNKHEAESALARAQVLMEKYKLTEDDVSEDAFEVVGDDRDLHREPLAVLAASVQSCKLTKNRRGQLGIRGNVVTVKRAIAFYASSQESYRASLNHMERIVASYFRVQCEAVWRVFWLRGFVTAVGERDSSARSRMPPEAIQKMNETVRDISYNIDMNWLSREAERSGRSAGLQISLRLEDSDFALPMPSGR